MSRNDLLKYIERTHGDALAQVGLMATDTQECLFYVIDDALRQSNDEKRRSNADQRVAILINDRRQMLDLPDTEEEVSNVGNE